MPMTKLTKVIRPVNMIVVEQFCSCGSDVPVKYTGMCLDSYPPLYVHQCPVCERTYSLGAVHPKIDYEEQ
jgi:hypothetical protein